MATTTGVLTGMSKPYVYRQMGTQMGILVANKSKPRCLVGGSRGYYLGLHDQTWYGEKARASGTATYYVRIVPIWDEINDADGNPLMGTANTENTTLGTTFSFDPYPDDYACNGYRVWAGTVSETLYYQGQLGGQTVPGGRYATTFTIGTTWTLNTSSGETLSAQTIGPPAFGTALEVFEAEGSVDSRIFLGGGKVYATGYAKVASTTSAPTLACGVAGTEVAATWQAVTSGSFRMMLGWLEATLAYEQTFDFDGISFAGAAGSSMANCAATLQTAIRAVRHPALYCGTGASTTIADWTGIGATGSFDIWVDGAVVHVTAVDFTGDASMADVAASIQTGMQAIGGSLAAATCTWDTTALIFVVKANSGTAAATSLLSYLYPNSSGTGTDISEPMKGRENSTAVHLQRRGKGATTAQSVAYSTDHFVFTSSETGQPARFGYLTTAATGTAVGGSGFMNGAVTATGSLYTPGLTAKRSIQGDGTAWGDWMEGMKFRISSESAEFLIGRVYDEDLIGLDSDYAGDGFFAWKEYFASPYDGQVYISALHNPFKYTISDIVQTPTADGDGVTAIRRNGSTIAVFMRHHIWMFDGVSITAPKMISNVWGAPNSDSCVEYGNGLAVFTGQDFVFVNGGEITKLDIEQRTKQYLDRISPYFTDYNGVFDDSENKEFIKWFIGLDGAFTGNTCFVCEPTTGNWWIHNVKDVSASCMVRNSINEKYLVTGETYDAGHAISAWIHLWSKDYKADGAVDSSAYDKDGKIASVGSATTTAGYLTCGTSGATLAQFQAVTAEYFRVTIDDVDYDVGPVDLSTATTLGGAAPSVATLLQTAVRAATGGTETVTYPSTAFIVTSGTTNARSNVSYLRPYRPAATMTSLADKTMMNGEIDHATETNAVTKVTLTLNNWTGTAANLYNTSNGEMGVWAFVCSSTFTNGQYARVVSNNATTITVSPNFTTAPVAGWYWYVGGIVPQWTKWLDWGSPQHKNKVHGVAVTVRQNETATGNTLAIHEMQDLSTTIRVSKTMPLGTAQDSTQTVYPADQACNQTGLKLMRPSSVHDLEIDDITISHRARV